MNRRLEIGVFVVAGIAAVAGISAAAYSFIDDGAPPSAAGRAEAAKTAKLRNDRYGFSFRYPAGWRTGPAPDRRVTDLVARSDNEMCMVSVHEQALPSDETGKPRNLGRLLAASGSAITRVPLPNARISSPEIATLGGQEARSFTVDAKIPPYGDVRVEAYATLRSFGAVVLTCIAPAAGARSAEIADGFRLVRTSFRFD